MSVPPNSLPYLSDTQMAQRPGIIDLGLGHPDPTLLPTAAIQQACAEMFRRFGNNPLNYGWAAGPGPLTDILRQRIGQREGRAPLADEIMITGGISHALDHLVTLCTQPGDVVLVESPTYHLGVRILRDRPVQLVPVPTDADGPKLDVLHDTLHQLKQAGQRPRLLYAVPTFNNPTGASWSLARRHAVIEIAAREGFLIVEDDAYRELAYDAPAPPSLWSLAPAGVVARLGSFSKSLAPGLRIGWLTADARLIQQHVTSGLLDSGGGVNQFTASVVAAYLDSGREHDAQVAHFATTYRSRRDALLQALSQHMPKGCTWDVPHGGFFVWITLPAGVSSRALLPQAVAHGVAFVPGYKSHLDQIDDSHIRLAFTLYEPEQLVEGVRRLALAMTH